MLEVGVLISFFSFMIWVFLFVKAPFRPSLVILTYSFFSFSIRPIAVATCSQFSPFYMFNQRDYEIGILLVNGCIFIYLLSYAAFFKRGLRVDVIDYSGLRKLANVIFILIVLFLVVALAIFGPAILPGMRTTGLSKAASGSQVFFAIVSTLVVPAIALRILLFSDRGSTWKVRAVDMIMISIIMILSMIFYQRGPAIQGVALGMFLALISKNRNRVYLYFRMVPLLLLGAIVVIEGRSLVSKSVVSVYGGGAVASSYSTDTRSLSCRVAMSGSQEHDQVWPTVFEYVERNGPDYYKNLFSAIFRPFYSAEERDKMNLSTSVDALNIFNDPDTYLDRNFGFSITGWQYHYFSAGVLVLPFAFIIGMTSAVLENRIIRSSTLNYYTFLRLLIVVQLIGFLNGAFDERLKWLIFSIILLSLAFKASRVRIKDG